MWMVDPDMMCNQHLLAEHVELHMMVGIILAGRSLQGYIDEHYVEIHNIIPRHDILVREMTKRGMVHKSPLKPFQPWAEGVVDINKNMIELIRRCDKCGKRWVDMMVRMDKEIEEATSTVLFG
jgi:hypothetical protein